MNRLLMTVEAVIGLLVIYYIVARPIMAGFVKAMEQVGTAL